MQRTASHFHWWGMTTSWTPLALYLVGQHESMVELKYQATKEKAMA